MPEADGAKYFEFDWSYWPEGIEATAARRPDGTDRNNREYWSVLPGGFFGIRDQYDVSRDAFVARCQQAVELGVRFCVMIDQDAHDLTVFRAESREHVVIEAIGKWSLREIPDLGWNKRRGSAASAETARGRPQKYDRLPCRASTAVDLRT